MPRSGPGPSTGLPLPAIVVTVPVLASIRRMTWAQWWPVLLLGVVFTGMNFSLYTSVSRVGLGLAVTLEVLGPLAVAHPEAMARAFRTALNIGADSDGLRLLAVEVNDREDNQDDGQQHRDEEVDEVVPGVQAGDGQPERDQAVQPAVARELPRRPPPADDAGHRGTGTSCTMARSTRAFKSSCPPT